MFQRFTTPHIPTVRAYINFWSVGLVLQLCADRRTETDNAAFVLEFFIVTVMSFYTSYKKTTAFVLHFLFHL